MKDRGSELDSQYYADGRPPLLNHKAAYDVETIAHALTNIYRRNVDVDHDIEPYLYEETQRIMDEAIAEGYANAAENNIPTPDEAFRNAFSHSADVFSAFRVHKMQTDIASQMLDSDGHLKPFSKFVKDVSPYIEHRNRAWLQTEYDTAIIRAQNAAEWQQFQTEKDVFPNLEWIPSTSPNPGADHQVFWGTVLPVDHPFWNEHKPGDRWNCKCELRQTDRDATPVPTSDGKSDPAPGLESNPATDREPFSDRHPYYPSGCSSCPFAGNRLVALVHDLAGRGKHCNDCVKANQKIEKAENYKQWEQNKADYKKYNADPDYRDVDFNEKTGGLKARHKDHNKNKKGNKIDGLTPFQIEKEFQDNIFDMGGSCILENEKIKRANGSIAKCLDIKLNGVLMDIRTISQATTKIENALTDKHKQLVIHNKDFNDKASTVCLYFHTPSYYSAEKIQSGITNYQRIMANKKETCAIKKVIVVINGEKKILEFDL